VRVKELNGSHIGAKVLIVDQKNHIQIEGLLRNIEHSGNGRLIYGELGARMMIHNLTTVISIGTVDKIYIDPEGEAQVEAESIRRHLLKKVLAITVALEQSTRAVKSMLNSMSWGNVVAVWFRCQPLPFTQSIAMGERAEEMRSMYEREAAPKIEAVVLRDEE